AGATDGAAAAAAPPSSAPQFRLEVVLAEGGSSDGTAGLCERLAAMYPERIRVQTGLPRSASAKRNAGARLARGRWLAFTDPDVVVDRGWLLALYNDFHAGETCLTGRVEQLQAGWQTSLRLSTTRRRYTGTLWERATAWKIGGAGNIACTHAAFDQIGGFSEDVGPGTPNGVGEDPDFIYRMLRAGVPILYDPAAVVHHDHAENFAQFLRKKRGYFKGGVYFVARRAFFTPAGQLALALRFGYPAAMLLLSLLTLRFRRLRQAWHEGLGACAGLWRALVAPRK
ncbi:MAG: glycosyltransferase, partial [Planctomycetota bacterium]